MEIDEREIEQVLSRYTTSKLETIERLVALFGEGEKELLPEDRIIPTKRADFFDYIKNIYDRLHPEGSEQREELLQSLKERLDEDSEQVLRGVGDGTQNIDTIDRTFNNLLGDTGERKGSFSAVVAMWDDKYRDKDEEMKIKIPDEEIKQYVFAIFYGELPNDQKKGKIEKLCEDMKESIRCISAIYQQLAEIEQHTASSDKKSKKLLKLMIAIVLRYTANVDEDVKEALDNFLEQIAHSQTISESKKAQLMCLWVFFTADPQMQRYLYQGLGEIARTRCVNALLSLCDKNSYKSLIGGESKRVENCLEEIQSDMESLMPESGNQRVQELQDMVAGIKDILDTKAEEYLLAGSSKIKKRLKLLMLPEHYKAMIGPNDKETEWIYYVLGAIDLLDKTADYSELAKKLRKNIISGLEERGLVYRESLIEDRPCRYIADKDHIPGAGIWGNNLLGKGQKDENRENDNTDISKRTYTRKRSEDILLTMDEELLKRTLGKWRKLSFPYYRSIHPDTCLYIFTLHCISSDKERQRKNEDIKCIYDFILNGYGRWGQDVNETMKFLLQGSKDTINFILKVGANMAISLLESLGSNQLLLFIGAAGGAEKTVEFIGAIGTQHDLSGSSSSDEEKKKFKLVMGESKFIQLLQAGGNWGEEIAKFIKQLSLGQVNALGKRDVLFPFINELGGENLGKFMSEFGIRLGGAGKEDNPVSNDLKKALHIDNKDEFIDLAKNGSAENIKDMMKKYGGDKLAILQIENGIYMRCGVPIDKLTDTQIELLKKLTPEQVQELSQKVRINTKEGQIEFTDIGLAIQDKNAATEPVHKEMADQAVQEAGSGWRLPKDKSSRRDYNEKVSLDPEKSDYDKMILQMPGQTDLEQVENFRLLTGMEGWYWTGTYYSKWEPMTRYFAKDCRGRDASSYFSSRYIRLVRDL